MSTEAVLIGSGVLALAYLLYTRAKAVSDFIRRCRNSTPLRFPAWVDGPAMQRFDIVGLRIIAIFWALLGAALVLLTLFKFVSE